MALKTCVITARVSMPDGTPAQNHMKFAFNGFDVDGETIVRPHVVVAPVANGSMTTALWPNNRGLRATKYEVFVSKDPRQSVVYGDVFLGHINVPDVDAVRLTDLMAMPPMPGFGETIVMSQAEYNALQNPDPRKLYLIVS